MLNVNKFFNEIGPASALLAFIGPVVVAWLCMVVSRALWSASRTHGFGRKLAGCAVAIGTIALASWITFFALVLLTGIGGQQHLSPPIFRLISYVTFLLSAIFSFMLVRSSITTRARAGKQVDIIR